MAWRAHGQPGASFKLEILDLFARESPSGIASRQDYRKASRQAFRPRPKWAHIPGWTEQSGRLDEREILFLQAWSTRHIEYFGWIAWCKQRVRQLENRRGNRPLEPIGTLSASRVIGDWIRERNAVIRDTARSWIRYSSVASGASCKDAERPWWQIPDTYAQGYQRQCSLLEQRR